MIRFRVLLIAAGYPDANDCDALRTDPAFKMAVGRLPESGADLCSQPTMCRLENLPTATALKRMMAAMVELFCDSFAEVPRRIVLDIDDTERSGARPPAARALPRPLRRALLPADPRLRGDHRQAGGGDPAPRQDPGRGRGGARPAPRDPAHPRPLAQGRHPGPRRQPLRPAGGHELVRAQPGRLRLRPGRQQGPARARGGPRRGGGPGAGSRARPRRSAATASSPTPPRPGAPSGG